MGNTDNKNTNSKFNKNALLIDLNDSFKKFSKHDKDKEYVNKFRRNENYNHKLRGKYAIKRTKFINKIIPYELYRDFSKNLTIISTLYSENINLFHCLLSVSNEEIVKKEIHQKITDAIKSNYEGKHTINLVLDKSSQYFFFNLIQIIKVNKVISFPKMKKVSIIESILLNRKLEEIKEFHKKKNKNSNSKIKIIQDNIKSKDSVGFINSDIINKEINEEKEKYPFLESNAKHELLNDKKLINNANYDSSLNNINESELELNFSNFLKSKHNNSDSNLDNINSNNEKNNSKKIDSISNKILKDVSKEKDYNFNIENNKSLLKHKNSLNFKLNSRINNNTVTNFNKFNKNINNVNKSTFNIKSQRLETKSGFKEDRSNNFSLRNKINDNKIEKPVIVKNLNENQKIKNNLSLKKPNNIDLMNSERISLNNSHYNSGRKFEIKEIKETKRNFKPRVNQSFSNTILKKNNFNKILEYNKLLNERKNKTREGSTNKTLWTENNNYPSTYTNTNTNPNTKVDSIYNLKKQNNLEKSKSLSKIFTIRSNYNSNMTTILAENQNDKSKIMNLNKSKISSKKELNTNNSATKIIIKLDLKDLRNLEKIENKYENFVKADKIHTEGNEKKKFNKEINAKRDLSNSCIINKKSNTNSNMNSNRFNVENTNFTNGQEKFLNSVISNTHTINDNDNLNNISSKQNIFINKDNMAKNNSSFRSKNQNLNGNIQGDKLNLNNYKNQNSSTNMKTTKVNNNFNSLIAKNENLSNLSSNPDKLSELNKFYNSKISNNVNFNENEVNKVEINSSIYEKSKKSKIKNDISNKLGKSSNNKEELTDLDFKNDDHCDINRNQNYKFSFKERLNDNYPRNLTPFPEESEYN